MRKGVGLAYLVFTLTSWLLGSELGEAQAAPQLPVSGGSYAIVVGIDDYATAAWEDLATAVLDATAVARLLEDQGFEVDLLVDQQATRQAILASFFDLAGRVRKGDRTLFYFAGHGYTKTYSSRQQGFLVPQDGEAPSLRNAEVSYLSLSEIREFSRRAGWARHQLFVLDSCFGGLAAMRGVAAASGESVEALADLVRLPARHLLAAGAGDQRVQDLGPLPGHSLFTGQFLIAIREGAADCNADGWVTFTELKGHLQNYARGAHQTPIGTDLEGGAGGEFLFRVPPSGRRREPCTPRSLAHSRTLPNPTRPRSGGPTDPRTRPVPVFEPGALAKYFEVSPPEEGTCKGGPGLVFEVRAVRNFKDSELALEVLYWQTSSPIERRPFDVLNLLEPPEQGWVWEGFTGLACIELSGPLARADRVDFIL